MHVRMVVRNLAIIIYSYIHAAVARKKVFAYKCTVGQNYDNFVCLHSWNTFNFLLTLVALPFRLQFCCKTENNHTHLAWLLTHCIMCIRCI